MGDRCYLRLWCLPDEEEKIRAELDFSVDEDDGSPDAICLVEEEANYAYSSDLERLAKAGFVFHGYHGEGSSYGPGVFAAWGGELVECASLDCEPVVSVQRDGTVNILPATLYWGALARVQAEFERVSTQAEVKP
jgi:hypothetical protein